MGKRLIITTAALIILIAYFVSRRGPKSGRVVEIQTGKIWGIVSKSRDGRDFYEWLGIPYAKPPVGQLRFASPVPVERWNGIKDGSKYGPKCAQLEMLTNRIIGDEDCLYLNVFVPKVGDDNILRRDLPVMVYFHGGGFNHGSADDYRPEYFMDEDVILVILNYRLGSFGFLSTGNEVVRGNMGLKDQVLALQWVQLNIRAFGGDPARVTIFGESAGGSSVHYHLLSSRNQGLFSRAIAQSGVASVPFAFDRPEVTKNLTRGLAISMGCDYNDSVMLVQCLRSVSAHELLRASLYDNEFNTLLKPDMHGHPFRPTVEAINDSEAFITEHPLAIVAKGQAHRVPCLFGVNADEGLLSTMEFHRNKTALSVFESDWESAISRTFAIPKTEQLPEIASQIRQFYFPQGLSSPSREAKLKIYATMFTDAVFNFHLSETARLQRNFSSQLYLYRFNFHHGPSIAPLLAEIGGAYLPLVLDVVLILAKLAFNYYALGEKPKDYGVCHADDLPMLFATPGLFTLRKNKNNPDEMRLYNFSKDMVKLWVDFASNEGPLQFRGVTLEAVQPQGPLEYFELSEEPKMIPEPFEDRINFLRSLNYLQLAP